MAQTKQIKNRINSVKSTKKITGAMQMIATVKMKKAVDAAEQTRAYAKMALDLLNDLGSSEVNHPLANKRNVKNHLLVVISSNRGLCGSYNSNILRTGSKLIAKSKERKAERISILAVGKKAAKLAKQFDLELIGLYENLADNPTIDDIYTMSEAVQNDFIHKKFDKVTILYTEYVSGLTQEVRTRQLLPVSIAQIENLITNEEQILNHKSEIINYEYEPSKKNVLKTLLPMLVDTQMHQAVLESAASEHASRMIAMKNASDAASDMVDDLTLVFNKSRQAAITQEIAEISAGAI